MSVEVEDLNSWKEKGNYFFSERQYKQAIEAYGQGLSLLDDSKTEELSQEVRETKAKLAANQAECYLRSEKYDEAVAACDVALRSDPSYIKALFRRAMAYEKLEQPTDAMCDLSKLLQIQPTNESISEAARRVQVQVQREMDIKRSFESHVEKIVHNRSTNLAEDVHAVMAKLQSAETYHKPVMTSGICQKMQAMVMDPREKPENKIIVAKALRSMFLILKDNVRLKVEHYENFVQNCIGLLRYGNPIRNQDLNEGLEKVLGSLLAIMVSDKDYIPREGNHLTEVLDAFIEFLSAGEPGPDGQLSRKHFHRIDVVIQGTALMAQNDPRALYLSRKKMLPYLLVSKLTEDVRLHKSIISCLVALSKAGGQEIEEPKPAEEETKKIKPKGKHKKKKKSQQHKKKHPATDFQGICKQWIETPLLASSAINQAKALRSLSLVLRAHQQTGIRILERSEVLQRVIDISGQDDENAKVLAAEVLALASSDTRIRSAITKTGNFGLFMNLVNVDDPTIQCHATLALSKYAAGDATIREQCLKDNDLLSKSLACLEKLETYESKESDSASEGGDPTAEMSAYIQNAISTVIETVTYLSIHVEVKKALVTHDDGAWLKHLIKYAPSSNRSIRHGIVQICLNLTMSTEDRKALYNTELEKLKKVAQRGLKKQNKEREVMDERAGSTEDIQAVRVSMTKLGVVKAISDCVKVHRTLVPDDVDSEKEMDKPEHLRKSGAKDSFMESAASCISNISSETENRGIVVQQGGLRLLLDLEKTNSTKAKRPCQVAIARICITTNPVKFKSDDVPALVAPLKRLCRDSDHELEEFEGYMALTNLAGLNEDTRERIIHDHGWSTLRDGYASTNFQVQRAALEVMCNLCGSPLFIEKMIKGGDQDIKIWLAFSKTDDERTVLAASGAIAQISAVPELAQIIVKHNGVETLTALAKHPSEGVRQRAEFALKNLEGVTAAA